MGCISDTISKEILIDSLPKVDFYLWMADRANNYAFQIKHSKGIPQNGSGFQHFFQPYFKVTEKTDIKISALSNGAAAHVHAGFDIVLVENA